MISATYQIYFNQQTFNKIKIKIFENWEQIKWENRSISTFIPDSGSYFYLKDVHLTNRQKMVNKFGLTLAYWQTLSTELNLALNSALSIITNGMKVATWTKNDQKFVLID